MKREVIGVDLGTRNTVIYSATRREIVFNEPTSLALDRATKQIREIGFLADEIQGKAPYSYQIVYPVRNGLIQDVDLCFEFLSRALESLDLGRRNFSIVFIAPSRTSKVNREALQAIGSRLFAKDIYIESEAKIAALGVGDMAYAPSATLVCDIGAGYTDIAMVSMGEIVVADSIFVGGDDFDGEIRRYLRSRQHLIVGSKSAEYAKLRVGNVLERMDNRLVEIRGRDTMTNLPASIVLSSSELKELFLPLAERIALKITDLLSVIQPELITDLVRNGLLLVGGGAALLGLQDYLEKTLSMPVRRADRPMEAIAGGFLHYIDRLEERKK